MAGSLLFVILAFQICRGVVLPLGKRGYRLPSMHQHALINASTTALAQSSTSNNSSSNNTVDKTDNSSNETDNKTDGFCAPLTNVQGTHFTATVIIDEMHQNPHFHNKFDLLVDTGSPWLVVEDCRCKDEAYCRNETRCFWTNHTKPEKEVVLMHGTGNIQVAIGSANVRLLGTRVSSYMDQGLLLMVDQLVNRSNPFEGVLGLGLPKDTLKANLLSQTVDDVASPYFEDAFLSKAGISRFSVCFSDDTLNGSTGVLRLGTSPPETKYGITRNTKHWQLALNDASVGNRNHRLNLCAHTDGMDGQDSMCAAILDSGTTYILGPEDKIVTIFEELCEQWPRCKSNYTATAKRIDDLKSKLKEKKKPCDKFDSMKEKALVFQLLLNDCNNWYDEKEGLNEIPELQFHIASRNGFERTLYLDPWSFIVKEERRRVEILYQTIEGIDGIPVGHKQTQHNIWTCAPALAAMDYSTQSNGQGWVLGQPLFYSYVVVFDTATNPPSISFKKQPCGTCDDAENSDRYPELHKRSPRSPRQITGDAFLPKEARKVLL